MSHELTISDLHAVYSLMLAHLFTLSSKDEDAIRKRWQCVIYGDEVAWPSKPIREMAIEELLQPSRPPAPIKICSMPYEYQKLRAAEELSNLFDLHGVPGFYQENILPGPNDNDLRAAEIAEFGPWRINLPMPRGLLVPYDGGTGYIIGVQIYKSVYDRHPTLMTSRGLPCGAKALMPRDRRAA